MFGVAVDGAVLGVLPGLPVAPLPLSWLDFPDCGAPAALPVADAVTGGVDRVAGDVEAGSAVPGTVDGPVGGWGVIGADEPFPGAVVVAVVTGFDAGAPGDDDNVGDGDGDPLPCTIVGFCDRWLVAVMLS